MTFKFLENLPKRDAMKWLILSIFLIAGCGKNPFDKTVTDAATQTFNSFSGVGAKTYFSQASSVTLEVYYEPGATPWDRARQLRYSWKGIPKQPHSK
jgi:hypothetical protein